MKEYKVFSFTVVHSSFGEFIDKVPYIVAILEDSDFQRRLAALPYDEYQGIAINQSILLNDSETDDGSPG